MAVSSGFFNSVSHDRQYNASHFGEFFDGIINDGVFITVGDQFAVTPGTGMKVNVAAGKGWFKGTYILNDAPIVLSINAADPILRRIDAVVLDINTDSQVRRNTIIVVTGTAGSNPDKPTLIDTQRHKQYPLAYITVPAGSTKISSQNIEDCIASGETPKAKSLLESDAMAKNHYCSEDPNNEVLDVAHGGTGASSAAGARTNLGLGSVATESTLPVSKGGTGKTSITSGTVLVGNGTNTPKERTIDTTSGGTANSNALITSGAVNSKVREMQSTFQDGVDTIYDAVVAEGITPSASTPSAIASAVGSVYDKGVTDAQSVTWQSYCDEHAYGQVFGTQKYISLKTEIDMTNAINILFHNRPGTGTCTYTFLDANGNSIETGTLPSTLTIPSNAKKLRITRYWDYTNQSSGAYYGQLDYTITYQTKMLR